MPNPYQNHAIMVICAADVDQIWHNATHDDPDNQGANPTLPAPGLPTQTGIGYIHSGNFDAVAQIRGDDFFLVSADPVYYALILKAKVEVGPIAAGDFLLAIRGTMDKLEWLNDAAALLMTDMDDRAQGQVGVGFIDVYRSMFIAALDGTRLGDPGTYLTALFKNEPAANVFVCGHSLGAALATYLTYDLVGWDIDAAERLKGYFFASPKTGTADWVKFYQSAVPAYELVNYALDFVPMVPPDGQALSPGGPAHNVHNIPGFAPGAIATGLRAPFDAADNHSPMGYARMLDGSNPIPNQILACRPAPGPSGQ